MSAQNANAGVGSGFGGKRRKTVDGSQVYQENAQAESRENEGENATKGRTPMSVQPYQPEDGSLTGENRTEQHRLLKRNVESPEGQSKPHPDAVAGIHSTGSFTGANPTDSRTDEASEAKSK